MIINEMSKNEVMFRDLVIKLAEQDSDDAAEKTKEQLAAVKFDFEIGR